MKLLLQGAGVVVCSLFLPQLDSVFWFGFKGEQSSSSSVWYKVSLRIENKADFSNYVANSWCVDR